MRCIYFFIVLSFIFYLGQPLLMFFDISFDIVMSIGSSPYDSTQINKTLKFLLTSIAVFHGSVLVYQVFSNVFHRKKYFSTNDENDYLLKSFRYVGIFLFLISVIPQFMYIYESIKTTILFGYSNIFKSDYIIGSGVQGGIPRFLAEFFKSALLLITISYLNDKKRLKRWIVFSILYSILLIVSGQRGSNTLFIFSLFFYIILV
ncbi:O-antigen polysaccharide polymerase Wzy [Exiguobacterium sp. JMULE1]|nr:O-antigen polysaccharide polymerase Wzy [Exiguobacterium sp. JMULE1]